MPCKNLAEIAGGTNQTVHLSRLSTSLIRLSTSRPPLENIEENERMPLGRSRPMPFRCLSNTRENARAFDSLAEGSAPEFRLVHLSVLPREYY